MGFPYRCWVLIDRLCEEPIQAFTSFCYHSSGIQPLELLEST